MPNLKLTTSAPATVAGDALVLGVAAAQRGPQLLGGQALPAELRRAVTGALKGLGVDGSVDQVVRLPSGGLAKAGVLALVGVGPAATAGEPEALRRAAGSATRSLAGLRTVVLALPADEPDAAAAVAEGALLGGYAFRRYRNGGTEPVRQVVVVTAAGRGAAGRLLTRRAEALAGAVHLTRDLVNTPPVDLYPSAFADQAISAVADLPVKVTVLDERKLAKGGYGGLIAVGMGSARPPRLVTVQYAPKNAARHVALVGKGITFDSGGLSIKPAGAMETMKSDMAGAAAVLATVRAAAQLELPVKVTGYLALAENMPSGSAQRPSDVITIRGGRTVEVLNTDAEGRLVLADALVAASETGPDLIVDIATLTGAQMVALGNRTSAVMSNDEAFQARLHRLAGQVGEAFWPMPLPSELRSSLDSPVADIANIGDRYGGMLVAGLFLKEFLTPLPGAPAAEQATAWAHLDIAGPSFNSGSPWGYTPVGGTGTGVRLMLALLEEEGAA